MIVYIAGRMRGVPYYNFPAFDAARDALQARGHTVISPADLDREHGFDAMTLPPDYDWNRIPEGFDLAACIRRDVDAVLRCDALVFLPGDWTASIGGKSEFAVARWAQKPVYQLSEDLAEMRKVNHDVVIRAAPHRVNDSYRYCPAEWEKLTGIRVVDPDGWRSPQEKDWSEPIDKAEWEERMMRSTVQRQPSDQAAFNKRFDEVHGPRFDAAFESLMFVQKAK